MLNRFSKLLEVVRNSLFLRNLGKMITGTGVAHLIGLAVIPLIVRFYSPDQIGLYASYLSLIAIIQSFASLRYEYATLIPGNQIAANNITALSVFFAALVSSLVLFALLVGKQQILGWLNLEAIGSFILFLPFSVFSYAVVVILWMSHNRIKQYGNIAKGKITASGSTGSIQVIMGWLAISPVGLLIGKIAGDLLAAIYLLVNRFQHVENPLKGVSVRRMKAMAKRYRYFPYWNAPDALSAALSANIPTLVIITFFSEATAGFYAIAIKVLFVPIQVISTSVYQVFSQRISEKYVRKEVLTSFFTKSVLLFAGAGLIPFIILFVYSPSLFSWLLGPQYEASGRFVQLLIPFFYVSFVLTPFNYITLMLNRQRDAFFIGMVYLLLRVLAMGVGVWFNDISLLLILYSLVGVLMSLGILAWYWQLVSKADGNR